MYKVGKSSSLGGKHSTTHDMGKKTPSTFSKVSASAGKSSGTKRTGDSNGAPVMGKGK